MKKCIWRRAFAAGVLICLGCVVNLKVGGVAGAILFSAGLWFVVNFNAELFTGRVTQPCYSAGQKLLMLLFNVLGALGCGLLVCTLVDPITEQAGQVMNGLASWGPLTVFAKGVMCGICMYLATTKAGEGSRLPFVIYGVALFILSGYAHSVAIAGYMGLGLWAGLTDWGQLGAVPLTNLLNWAWVLPVAALGNAVGSYLTRWMLGPVKALAARPAEASSGPAAAGTARAPVETAARPEPPGPSAPDDTKEKTPVLPAETEEDERRNTL